jgi:hypothetical protein
MAQGKTKTGGLSWLSVFFACFATFARDAFNPCTLAKCVSRVACNDLSSDCDGGRCHCEVRIGGMGQENLQPSLPDLKKYQASTYEMT